MFLHSVHTRLTLFQVCTVQPSIKNNDKNVGKFYLSTSPFSLCLPHKEFESQMTSDFIWLRFEKHNEKLAFKNS